MLKPNGRIIIIDKPIEKLNGRKLFDYEQWIDDGVIRRFCKEQNGTLNINENVPYEGNEDGLFRAWILRKV